ncbi:MAG: DUF167 domain-containing protein [Candidatus Aenigmarchaeota archaeon]|nr:DUF167 domain-containing protein [Candidatus Aenigmarchaeota archaeon]
MRIKVRVTPNAKKNAIIREADMFRIRLAAPAKEGKANSALIELLAGHFKVRKNAVRIVSGHKSREKIVQVDD